MKLAMNVAALVCAAIFATPAFAQSDDGATQRCGSREHAAVLSCCCTRATQADLDAAEQDLAHKRERYEAIRHDVEADKPGDVDTVVVSELLSRRTELRARLADLSRVLDPESPTMRALLAQADELERVLRAELQRLLASLQTEVDIAQQRVARLQEDLAADESDAAEEAP